MIYKIFRQDEWESFRDAGETRGAPIDLADGFIHFSTLDQVPETAAKHFDGVEDLFLAAFDETGMGPSLKWEISRGGAEFPHLYRKLALGEMVWCVPLPLGANGHVFPENLT